jgi:hypothetical protein
MHGFHAEQETIMCQCAPWENRFARHREPFVQVRRVIGAVTVGIATRLFRKRPPAPVVGGSARG